MSVIVCVCVCVCVATQPWPHALASRNGSDSMRHLSQQTLALTTRISGLCHHFWLLREFWELKLSPHALQQALEPLSHLCGPCVHSPTQTLPF